MLLTHRSWLRRWVTLSVIALLATAAYAIPPVAAAPSGTVVITEFMASNSNTLDDVDGDASDWIELYNPGASAVDLTGWHLTDDAADPTQWTFPAVSIAAGAYLVVFASGKDLTGAELHTNFKLGAGGEYLGLVESDGTTIAWEYAPEFPQQFTDVSYGVNSSDELRYFTTPTPGSANGTGYAGLVESVSFSAERGFYDSSFDVTLSTSTPGATITYTLDGSVPTVASTAYSSPIPVATTTTLRAAAFLTDYLPAPTETQTYIFLDDVLTQPADISGFPHTEYPVDWTNTVPLDTEMDPTIVSDPVYGPEMADAMEALPTMSIVADPGDIFGDGVGFYDTDDLIKPVSVELIYPDDPTANQQVDAGIESHSHAQPKRSLRLNFKTEYGDSVFETDLFQQASLNGESATDQIKRIVLRAGHDRSWAQNWWADQTTYLEDQFYRDNQLAVSGVGSHGTFVHLYINGVYWGIYNPVERPDEHFTSEYLGGDSDDWFFLNHGGATDGDSARWDYLTGDLIAEDMTVSANYAEMQDYLDIDEYIDYLIINWYQGQSDWLSANWYFGNRADASPLGSTPGQYYAWDGEISWDVSEDYTAPGGPWVHPAFLDGATSTATISDLWHALRPNDDFMMEFADRVYRHLYNGGALTDANALTRWQTLVDALAPAIIGESARWGDALETVDATTRERDIQWQAAVDAITGYITGSQAEFIAAVDAAGFLPTTLPPQYSQYGGDITAGYDLTMTNPNGAGTIYYTTDGSDPRLSGGAVNPAATTYAAAIDLPTTTEVKARVLDSGEWSALADATFTVTATPATLRITEMNYHPADPSSAEIAAGFDDADEFEFIEIRNVGAAAVPLAGTAFTNGITFTFGSGTLASGEYTVLVSNQAAFEYRYGTGLPVAGEYPDQLSNGGEEIVLVDSGGLTIHDFTYDDSNPWPESPDGDGPALEVIDTEADYSDAANWMASTRIGGSPGSDADTTAPVITLLGADPQQIAQGDAYVELGATATDDVDGDLTASIIIDASNVDTATAGSYEVTYNVSDLSGNPADEQVRTVEVLAPPDTTAPVITLLGADPQQIVQGDAYVELGATATDDVDGDLTASIVIDASDVDTATVGTYEVTYNVSDLSGNPADEQVRTVEVVAPSNEAPVSDAGPDQTVAEGALVHLDGSASNDPDGDSLTYAWSQVSGTSVALSGATGPSPSFPAPTGLSADETLVFRLVVSDGTLSSPPDDVTVTVTKSSPDFVDVAPDNPFAGDIEWLADMGITKGCNPPVNDEFCPDGLVTREQMAAFLVRALGYVDDGGGDLFVDDDASIFEDDIDRLAAAGVTKGCNPPANDQFCPEDFVTREQMAAFLHRALGG